MQSNWSCAEIFLTLLVIVLGMWWVICCWITLNGKRDLLELMTLWNKISWLYSILSCICQHPVFKRIPIWGWVGNSRRIFRHLYCIISNLFISYPLSLPHNSSPWSIALTIDASYNLSLARIDSPRTKPISIFYFYGFINYIFDLLVDFWYVKI